MGAETLALRVKQSSDNAFALAQFLEGHKAIGKVFYPGLKSHPQYEIAQKLFKGASWLLSFELLNAERMIEVVNALELPIKATGLADTRTLIIPVAPTIFFEAGPETRKAMGISDGMLRLSAGIEDIDDLITDFSQALEFAA
jgi:O-acetylhomoserine (thiol)-lyase